MTAKDEKAEIENQLHVLGDGFFELRDTAAGLGVFALKKFEKNQPITEYYGKFISYDDAKKLSEKKTSHCRRHIAQQVVIDGRFMRTDGKEILDAKTQLIGHGVGAMCNDSAQEQNINASFDYADAPYNTKQFENFSNGGKYEPLAQHRVTFIRASKTIQPGDQICLNYGNDYWQRAGIKKI